MARNVAAKLRMFWSPEQIAGWLKLIYLRDESLPLGGYAGAAQANLLVADTGGRATIPVEIVLRIDAGKGTLAT